ncbi:MAG: PH domain-containing protein [Anaerolineales bacterium]|nr:PH domain-containing protein [Anaerolineales bacterium]
MLNENTAMIRAELDSGEEIVWQGQPRQGLLLRSSDIFLIPFSLMWGGFAIFWTMTAASAGAPFFFVLWGTPFVLVGLYLIIGRFFVDAWQRRRTYYALTNRRALIISGIFNQNVRTLPYNTMSEINITRHSNDRGTITFGPPPPFWQSSGGGWPTGNSRYPVSPAFEMIDRVNDVYEQLKRVQRTRATSEERGWS